MTFVDKQTGRNKNRDVNVYLEQGPWLILDGYTKQQKANNQVWIIRQQLVNANVAPVHGVAWRVAVVW